MMPREVVVITGATAGIGRATARLFARQGACIGLLAREKERLEATRREVEELGGKAIAIPTDVADAEQVEAAAERVERDLGPIDIWVNNAMATVFAPFEEVSPEDFKRVTDVTYHGYVWGTQSALKRMRKRNRGTIVQVGSALAYRSIPLQAAYCGAKHAIKGFTEAVRTELLHDSSEVHITMVEMPAVNTPQFEWCATTMKQHPRPIGTAFQPEVAAEAVVWAAHARRREIMVGLSSSMAVWGGKFMPALLDRYLARTAVSGQKLSEPVPENRPANLWKPVPGNYAARGRFGRHAYQHSPWLWLNMHRKWVIAMMAAGGAALAVFAGRQPGNRR
jgi:NAD(P)-dependent dehydrogenase (short-subunit alcohol dehydrogenase family)